MSSNPLDRQFVSEQKDRELRKGKLLRNDVVMTTRGTLGNVALYNDRVPYDHVRINSGMVVLRPHPDKLLSQFLYQIMRSRDPSQSSFSISTAEEVAAFEIAPANTVITGAVSTPRLIEELLQQLVLVAQDYGVDGRLCAHQHGCDRVRQRDAEPIDGNTALIIESEMFGQPTLRAKWKSYHSNRNSS